MAYCKNCGEKLPENCNTCVKCGAEDVKDTVKQEEVHYGPPEGYSVPEGSRRNTDYSNQQGYGNQQAYNQQYYNQVPNGPNGQAGPAGYGSYGRQPTPGFALFLTLSILQTICCNVITGIIGIVLSVMMDSDFKSGRTQSYLNNKKYAKIALIVGVALTAIGVAVYLFAVMGMFGLMINEVVSYTSYI